MKIREKISSATWTGYIVMGVCLVALVAGDSALEGSPWKWLLLIPMLVLGGTYFYLGFLLSCPKCHNPFGFFALYGLGSANHCPHCGISLDEQVLSPNYSCMDSPVKR
jgi:hypothetical protein